MDESKRIIEIDGVKVEVDLRTAKKVDCFRVGDNVKVLDKEYDDYKVKPGIIVDFCDFNDLPTMVVAVFDAGRWGDKPNIKFIHFNKNYNKEFEIVPCSDDEIQVSKDGVIERFEREINKKKNEWQDLQAQLDYFKEHFLKECKAD